MALPLKQTLQSIINRQFKGNLPKTRDFKPLYNKEKKFMLSLSAKSGSVYAVKWFFYHSLLWDEAKNYPQWIHKYRQDIHQHSKDYKNARLHFWQNPSNYTKIKLVRNPYSRAVSSYKHILRHPNLLRNDTKGSFSEDNLSFSEFIGWLEKLNIKTYNPHYRRQTHYFERFAEWDYDYLIKLESSQEDFAMLERRLGLPSSPFEELRESKHHSIHHQNTDFVGETHFSLGRSELSKYPYFYNKELVERVRALYQEDFENYGYSTEFNPPHP